MWNIKKMFKTWMSTFTYPLQCRSWHSTHIFSDSPQFQHTAPQFSQAVLSVCVYVVLPPLSLYSAQQHRKRAAAYARVEGLCIYIFGIAVLLFWRDVYKEKDTQLISLLPRRKKQQQQWKKSRASLVAKYILTPLITQHEYIPRYWAFG